MNTHKHQSYARSRMSSRADRRVDADLRDALQVAKGFVSARWPALAQVEPEVTRISTKHSLNPDLIVRLGIDQGELRSHDQAASAYTFTFASQCGVADGAVAPLVAAVTVDDQQRIVKTILSK